MGLVRDKALVMDFSKLWDATPSEEGREDILCCLGLFGKIEEIKALLIAEKEPKHDLTRETGILILQRRILPQAFTNIFDEIIVSNPACAAQLQTLRQRNFQSSVKMERAFWKTWDGFDLTIYDDGIQVSHDTTFSDFIPRNTDKKPRAGEGSRKVRSKAE